MADDRINIKTLSRLVGVSTSTVSRVLSGKAREYRIAPKTESKVMEKVRELGFRPNYFAHSLNTGKTYNIGLIMANSIDTFLGSIIEGAESYLRNSEYKMVLGTCENNLEIERAEIERMFYRQVDGIIIYPSALSEGIEMQRDCLREIVEKRIPLVVIGRDADVNADKVLFSDYEAGVAAALDFIAAGCRCFGSVTLPSFCSRDRERIRGYVDTLLQQGIKREAIIETTLLGDGNRTSSVTPLLPVDCIWGINTGTILATAGILQQYRPISNLRLRGLGIEPFVELMQLKITMVAMPSREMGKAAASLLLEQIGTDDKLPPRTVILPWPDLPA
jgi:DNA-binding LacI/PurR family transcriptional regulator